MKWRAVTSAPAGMGENQMRRRNLLWAVVAAALPADVAHAQPSERPKRVGILMPFSESDDESQALMASFRERLQQLGWTAGQNLQIHLRWTGADPRRLRPLAKEIVALHPDAIFARSTMATAAFQQETSEIPIVFAVVTDPVGDRLVASMARPGGNITGFSNAQATLGTKWLELIREMDPVSSHISVLFNSKAPAGAAGGANHWHMIERAAALANAKVSGAELRDPGEIERAIEAMGREPRSSLIVVPDPFTTTHRKAIIAATARFKVAAMYPYRFQASEGGLISYGVDLVDLYRRAAGYVDRVLRGQKPAELPVQGPDKFELVINLKTAKVLGLIVPPSLLAQADEVIE